jgi:hypothetical protein
MAEVWTISYPGLSRIVSARVRFPRGVEPGRIVLDCVGTDQNPAGIGMVTLTASESQTIQFPDCVPIARAFRGVGSPPGVTVTLVDRRWRWKYGTITGAYNVREGAGELRWPKTARELATMLAVAMDEPNADVQLLPDAVGPEVDWFGANPAAELALLAQSYGCVIGFTNQNRMTLYREGKGGGLPSLPRVFQSALAGETKQLPWAVSLYGGPDEFEMVLNLTPVGTETDGRILSIDQLSYKPAGQSWGRTYAGKFMAVTNEEHRKLAQRDVFRMFRVDGQGAIGSTTPEPTSFAAAHPSRAAITDLEQLEILNVRPGFVINEEGKKEPREARVFGVFLDPDEESDGNSAPKDPWPHDHSYRDSGRIVQLQKPAVRIDASKDIVAPRLWFQTLVRVRDSTNNVEVATEYRQVVSNGPGPNAAQSNVLVLHHPEIVRQHAVTVIPPATDNGTPPTVADDAAANAAELAAKTTEANYYIDATLDQYAPKPTGSMQAMGLWAVGHSGDITEVAWSLGGGPPTTSLTLNAGSRGDALTFEEQTRRADALSRAVKEKGRRALPRDQRRRRK